MRHDSNVIHFCKHFYVIPGRRTRHCSLLCINLLMTASRLQLRAIFISKLILQTLTTQLLAIHLRVYKVVSTFINCQLEKKNAVSQPTVNSWLVKPVQIIRLHGTFAEQNHVIMSLFFNDDKIVTGKWVMSPTLVHTEKIAYVLRDKSQGRRRKVHD